METRFGILSILLALNFLFVCLSINKISSEISLIVKEMEDLNNNKELKK